MNSLEKTTIQLPEKMKIFYQSDSSNLKQKIINYNFPYTTVVKNKNDTLVLNMLNISALKISTPVKNSALFFSTFIASLMILVPLKEIGRGNLSLLMLSIPSRYLTYLSISNIRTK